MRVSRLRRIIFLLVLAVPVIVTGCSENPGGNTPQQLSRAEINKQLPANDLIGETINTMPDTGLVDQTGASFSFEELPARPILMSFIYTRCPMDSMCPLITRKMKRVNKWAQNELTRPIQLVSVTFDPGYDTPAVLKQYARQRNVRLDNWSFVTGPERVIDELVDRFDITTKEVESGQVVHNLRTYLIDENHRVAEWYRGSEWTVKRLKEDLRKLESPPDR